MLVVHPASLCDVCLDPYIISSEPANSPHAIACGHIFCLTCLRNLTPSACPLCRKTFQPDRVKKLHVAGPPELDGANEEPIEGEATQLLQRVALVSGEDVPEAEIIEVVTQVEQWLADNSEDDAHQPLRSALDALQRFKALQERNERDYAEFRRVRRELKAYRRNAHQDSKTSRAIEESLLGRITEIESQHAQELSRLHAEIDSLRGDSQPSYRNTSNPLPPPPEPLPLDRFPPFVRPGGTADTPDPLLTAVPYPPPPPRIQPSTSSTTNGHPSNAAHVGTTHAQYAPPPQITQSLAMPRARHAEVPRGDERNKRPSTQEGNYPEEERRLRAAESSRTGASDVRHASTERRSKMISTPLPAPRAMPANSPAPSWAHHPLIEERRSDDERETRDAQRRGRVNGANGVIIGSSDTDARLSVEARLASAEAYIRGYGSGYDSGFQIASEPPIFAPSSYGSDRSDRMHGFPVQEPPDEPIGGLGLMGVQPITPSTVSTPDEDATPMNRPRGLARRNTTQVIDAERSSRRVGSQPPDVLPNGRRGPSQSQRPLGVRRAVTEGAARYGVNGTDGDLARHDGTTNGVSVPLEGENESPRSETTWGTVNTLSRDGDSIGGGSLGSLGMLVGFHNGGGARAGESYVGRDGRGDVVTSEDEEGETATAVMITSSLPGSESDVSSLGLVREDEGDHSGSRNRGDVESGSSGRGRRSFSERISHGTEAPQERQPPRARRDEGNHQRRHASQTSVAEAFHPESRRVVNASDITTTNALSLHFDASFPTHDSFSAPSGPEIFAPTPIVGGPNIIHLWANRT